MEHLVIIVVLVLVVAGILLATSGKNRYSEMSEEEFEKEAQRSSAIGNALMGVQGILDPSRKVEYVLQRDKRPEGDSAESGDRPPDQLPKGSDPLP